MIYAIILKNYGIIAHRRFRASARKISAAHKIESIIKPWLYYIMGGIILSTKSSIIIFIFIFYKLIMFNNMNRTKIRLLLVRLL